MLVGGDRGRAALTRPHPLAALLRTIGYQEATPDAVLGTLTAGGVNLLVDVRAVAASRRPGFSKRQLAAGAEAVGIGYLHLRGLGTPAEGRLAARTGRFDDLRRISGRTSRRRVPRPSWRS